ncbi:MAG: dephospho-CoA kinase [Clostridiales bacterium]|jgi:dephospho-CoA kinase|nr:dephospho-CoA kinase [Clostridiales bacterium]
MIIIGLTGGIASGKTTVAKMLADLGAVIIDADVVARRVMAKGMPVWERVRETFGKEYMTDNGDIDRKKLGELVFADRKALEKLNAITHPVIRWEILQEINRLASKKCCQVVVVDAALLIEAGWTEIADEVWLVVADKETQINRLRQRNGLSREQAMNRINSQMDQETKKKYADKVINNSHDIEHTRRQVERLWQELLS